jgi:XTP/dITP diphosphohydrolase
VGTRDSGATSNQVTRGAPRRVLLASSNPGKLKEYRELAGGMDSALRVELGLIEEFQKLPPFDEAASTFAENGAGKALHYSRFVDETVLGDDSGLVVPSLGGAPGVRSARYAGPNATDADRTSKLLGEMAGRTGDERAARFVCVTAIARKGRVLAVVSDLADGSIAEAPRGANGFGYDPVFICRELNRTFAEMSREEKNLYSHRGKAFRKIRQLLASPDFANIS